MGVEERITKGKSQRIVETYRFDIAEIEHIVFNTFGESKLI